MLYLTVLKQRKIKSLEVILEGSRGGTSFGESSGPFSTDTASVASLELFFFSVSTNKELALAPKI